MSTLTIQTSDASAERTKTSRGGLRSLLTINAIALLVVAVSMRVIHLENIPGINGDEAWSGVQALRLAHGEAIEWRTPTGNPVNVFLLLPLAALHLVAAPSFALLRSIAVVSGLAALVANYLLCRRAFDGVTAAISTLMLALLPIDVAYSRFAWDASQSLLVTVFVLYLTLIHGERGKENSLPIAGAIALAAAILVHPTNVFAAPLLVVPVIYQRRRQIVDRFQSFAIPGRPRSMILLTVMSVGLGYAAWWTLARAAGRWHGARDLTALAANYLQLLSGATVYEYISGAPDASGWVGYVPSASNGLFAVAAALGLWGLQRRMAAGPTSADTCLVMGGFVMLAGFFIVAGERAIAPHFERYGICLIAPAVLMLSRGLAWWIVQSPARNKWIAIAMSGCAWLWPITFQGGYFTVIESTGGLSHRTFRTGEVEPKMAAWRLIDGARDPAVPSRVVCGDWWSYWPLAYLAFDTPNVEVLMCGTESSAPWTSTDQTGRTWFVEFADSANERNLLSALAAAGIRVSRETLNDYAGRPVVAVIGPPEKFSQNN